jgi:hypothetical protein
MDKADLDDSRRGNLIRSCLTRRRYPEITRKHRLFAEGVKALRLGPSVRIDPPANFEGLEYSLTLGFTGPEEFRIQAEKVRTLAEGQALEALFQ